MSDRYTILKRELLADIGCYMSIYEHKITKAKVLYLELDGPSMSSLVMVRTPSENDKGLIISLSIVYLVVQINIIVRIPLKKLKRDPYLHI